MKENDVAFPLDNKVIEENSDALWAHGLTKREYIAIEAMKGILTNARNHPEYYEVNDGYLDVSKICNEAIVCADVLISELSKPKTVGL